MKNPNNLLAGVILAGFFIISCGQNEKKSQQVPTLVPPKLEKVKLDTFLFDCSADTMIPLGFINSDWVYENKPLGIRFRFPEGWNACEDPSKGNPPIYRVGGDLSRFRDEYTHPHSLRLSFMKGSSWNEKRYLFGITKTEPVNPLDEKDVDLSAAPLALAEIFYGEEYNSEETLYKDVQATMIKYWEQSKNENMLRLNKSTIRKVTKLPLANTIFYSHRIQFPIFKDVTTSETLVKKLDCIFLVISFHYKNVQERNLILDALKDLEIK